MSSRLQEKDRRRAQRIARERKAKTGVAAGGCLFGLFWLASMLCSLLITAALVAIAGDVIGLWEVVEFV